MPVDMSPVFFICVSYGESAHGFNKNFSHLEAILCSCFERKNAASINATQQLPLVPRGRAGGSAPLDFIGRRSFLRA